MKTNLALLANFAHPDDESFTIGGCVARYAAEGVKTALVCATRGEVGEISDPSLATPETLAEVREAELRCACRAMGIESLIFLGYRDSGMAGTPENEDPRAFTNIPAGEVVPRLVGIIRRWRPQVVITFDPEGGYGHPDHIAIHKHTVAAFHVAADPTRYPEQGAAWQPARLFYAVLPQSFFREMRAQMIAAGLDTSDFDRFTEERGEPGLPDDQVDVTMDVTRMVEAKWAALQCHQTQLGPDDPFRQLPEAVVRRLMSREYFVQAWPERDGVEPDDDLFAGLF
jgi:N-acetyl-1-D-myo-inositol-2-amino-2-deoxy-alpha-D-glucopyranoside deacetylase